jgi:hypothetical protein
MLGKSQDISCGMKKIAEALCPFGTKIAQAGSRFGHLRVTIGGNGCESQTVVLSLPEQSQIV